MTSPITTKSGLKCENNENQFIESLEKDAFRGLGYDMLEDHINERCRMEDLCWNDLSYRGAVRDFSPLKYKNKNKKNEQVPHKWYQRLFKKNRIAIAASQWERDLTRECIESNPGPTWQQRFREMIIHEPMHVKWRKIGEEYAPAMNIIEAYIIFIYQFLKAPDKKQKFVAYLNLMKHCDTTHSLTFGAFSQSMMAVFDEIMVYSWQSDVKFSLRSLLEEYEIIRDSELVSKVYTLGMYALSLSLFDKMGLSMTKLQFSKLEQEAIRRKYKLGPTFIHALLDTCVFLVEQGQQYLRTGKFESILHRPSEYGDWFESTYKLTNQYQFLSNPEPHGFTQYDFQSDLEHAIEQGVGIVNHAKNNKDKLLHEKTRSILNNLQLMKSNMISRKSAAASREAPFAVLVSGGSSVAKSTFVRILINYFGKVMKLPLGDEYIHTRNYMDDYFVNFRSSQWCVVLDDIALFNPDKSPQGDPSLCEIIQIVNSIAYNPPQAALEDKGKTPMLARFVVGTTNTPDLNAHHYFSCPLAVRRRMPYRIDIKPKEQYQKFGHMLDGTKVPVLEEGELPNYWQIEVYQVQPDPLHKGNHKQQARDVLVFKTDSIYDFVQWFAQKAKDFRGVQDKETHCKDLLGEISICETCYLPPSRCVCTQVVMQADTESSADNPPVSARVEHILNERARTRVENGIDKLRELESSLSIFELLLLFIVKLYYEYYFINCMMRFFFGETFIFTFIAKYFNSKMYKYLYKLFGKKAKERIKMCDTFSCLKYISATILVSICTTFAYKLCTRGSVDGADVPQGKEFTGKGTAPKPKEDERENVWYRDEYQLSTFDVQPATASMNNNDIISFMERIKKNIVYAKIHARYRLTWWKGESSGFCVGGHQYIFNNHLFPDLSGDVEMQLIIDSGGGTSENITIKIRECDVKRIPNRDIAILNIRQLPPRKDISKYFPKQSIKGIHKCYYLSKQCDGSFKTILVENVTRQLRTASGQFNGTLDLWMGRPKERTKYGQCGSLLISDSEVGPIILGFHAMLNEVNGESAAIPIYDTDADCMQTEFGKRVESGVPNLHLEQQSTIVKQLHPKSVFRYIEDGSVAVYGSIAGFRPKHKSRVELSYVARSFLQRGWQLRHGAPVMEGWEPWRIAAMDLIHPVTKLDTSLIRSVCDDFIADIKAKLDPSELECVHVLDDAHTINGAPGIAYLDKINRNTSAGFPWNKSKRYLMSPVMTESDIPDEYEVTEEVMQRVKDCIDKYEKRERYMPVFTAHLKDEATSFKKIKAAKTRVFTGAPLDYTIVVRKYLLSVIRLMQNNRFVFECGPGTIAQSLEWQEIMQHITKFGNDRMIAGDYKAFDKSMPPIVILEAFRILRTICSWAGYTEKELNVIDSIAEDTAYPLVNFNGDLVQFYGSNPSGHPLTVIINGLVNSLYLRYVYASLSPDKNAKKFQDHVAVMTYGDDNVMGVSKDISFFTHTNIQKCLSEVGITYTMADKEAASVPFIPLSEVSFLKREWRWDEDIGAHVAPLEEESIEKMVLIGVRSKTIPPEAQAIASMASAIREYFWHGRKVFEEKKKIFREVVEENELEPYVEDYVFPTWEELRKAFWDASKHLGAPPEI